MAKEVYGLFVRISSRRWDDTGSWFHKDEERFLNMASVSLFDLRAKANEFLRRPKTIEDFHGTRLQFPLDGMKTNMFHVEHNMQSTAHGYALIKEMPPSFKL